MQGFIIKYSCVRLDEEVTPPAPVTFTEDDLKARIAEATAELSKQQKAALSELEALKGKATLTAKERQALEGKIEELTTQNMTKDELAKRDSEKLQKKYETETQTLVSDRDHWKTQFTESTILREISDAASSNEAFNPAQIIAILKHDTQLKESVDKDGQPTGKLEARVRFKDVKDDQPIELDLTVTEAVKRMRDIEGYQNLFKGQGTGGLGDHNRGPGGKVDASKLTPAQYREARAKGLIQL